MNVSMFPLVTSEGIQVDVFFGESDEPTELLLPWAQFVEDEINFHTLEKEGRPIVVSHSTDGVAEVCEVIKSLRKACDELSEKLLEKQIFLREEWVKKGGDMTEHLVDFETYCDYIERNEQNS